MRRAAARIPEATLAALALAVACDGGAATEPPRPVTATFARDGSALVLGATSRFDLADPATGLLPRGDLWLGRFLAGGTERWQLAVGTEGIEGALGLVETGTGRIVTVGYALRGADADAWIVGVEAGGGLAFERLLASPGLQELRDVVELPGGDLVAVGNAITADGVGLLLVRLSGGGVTRWQRTLEASGRAAGVRVLARPDASVVVVAALGPLEGSPDRALVAQVDPSGELGAAFALGGAGGFVPAAALLRPDGALVLAGTDGVAFTEDGLPAAPRDLRLCVVGPAGELHLDLAFAGDGDEVAAGLVALEDGRLLLLASTDGEGSGIAGDTDLLALWITSDGALDRQRAVGGLYAERPLAARALERGEVEVVGVLGESIDRWVLTGTGALRAGCGIARETSLRPGAAGIFVQDAALTSDDPALPLEDGSAAAESPPPLAPPICSE